MATPSDNFSDILNGLQDAAQSADRLEQELNDISEKISINIDTSDLEEALELLREFGKLSASASRGSAADMDKVQRAFKSLNDQVVKFGKSSAASSSELKGVTDGLEAEYKRLLATIMPLIGATESMSGATSKAADSTGELADELKDLGKDVRDAAKSFDKGKKGAEALEEGLEDLTDEAKNTKNELDALGKSVLGFANKTLNVLDTVAGKIERFGSAAKTGDLGGMFAQLPSLIGRLGQMSGDTLTQLQSDAASSTDTLYRMAGGWGEISSAMDKASDKVKFLQDYNQRFAEIGYNIGMTSDRLQQLMTTGDLNKAFKLDDLIQSTDKVTSVMYQIGGAAKLTGQSIERVSGFVSDMGLSLGKTGQQSVDIFSRMAAEATKVGANIQMIQPMIANVAHEYQYLGVDIDNAIRTTTQMTGAFEKMGMGQAAAVGMTEKMISGFKQMSFAEKAFVGMMGGGGQSNALAAGFEVEYQLREGAFDAVAEKLGTTVASVTGRSELIGQEAIDAILNNGGEISAEMAAQAKISRQFVAQLLKIDEQEAGRAIDFLNELGELRSQGKQDTTEYKNIQKKLEDLKKPDSMEAMRQILDDTKNIQERTATATGVMAAAMFPDMQKRFKELGVSIAGGDEALTKRLQDVAVTTTQAQMNTVSAATKQIVDGLDALDTVAGSMASVASLLKDHSWLLGGILAGIGVLAGMELLAKGGEMLKGLKNIKNAATGVRGARAATRRASSSAQTAAEQVLKRGGTADDARKAAQEASRKVASRTGRKVAEDIADKATAKATKAFEKGSKAFTSSIDDVARRGSVLVGSLDEVATGATKAGSAFSKIAPWLKGASWVGTAASVGVGAYQYSQADTKEQRADVVGETIAGTPIQDLLGMESTKTGEILENAGKYGATGATMGASVGAFFGGVGAVPGAAIGGAVGASAGATIGAIGKENFSELYKGIETTVLGWFSEVENPIETATARVGRDSVLAGTPLETRGLPGPLRKFNDFLWRPGRDPVQFSPDDMILGMKAGSGSIGGSRGTDDTYAQRAMFNGLTQALIDVETQLVTLNSTSREALGVSETHVQSTQRLTETTSKIPPKITQPLEKAIGKIETTGRVQVNLEQAGGGPAQKEKIDEKAKEAGVVPSEEIKGAIDANWTKEEKLYYAQNKLLDENIKVALAVGDKQTASDIANSQMFLEFGRDFHAGEDTNTSEQARREGAERQITVLEDIRAAQDRVEKGQVSRKELKEANTQLAKDLEMIDRSIANEEQRKIAKEGAILSYEVQYGTTRTVGTDENKAQLGEFAHETFLMRQVLRVNKVIDNAIRALLPTEEIGDYVIGLKNQAVKMGVAIVKFPFQVADTLLGGIDEYVGRAATGAGQKIRSIFGGLGNTITETVGDLGTGVLGVMRGFEENILMGIPSAIAGGIGSFIKGEREGGEELSAPAQILRAPLTAFEKVLGINQQKQDEQQGPGFWSKAADTLGLSGDDRAARKANEVLAHNLQINTAAQQQLADAYAAGEIDRAEFNTRVEGLSSRKQELIQDFQKEHGQERQRVGPGATKAKYLEGIGEAIDVSEAGQWAKATMAAGMPKIMNAFQEEGLKAGGKQVLETAKDAGAMMAGRMGGQMIGAALTPVLGPFGPIVGQALSPFIAKGVEAFVDTVGRGGKELIQAIPGLGGAFEKSAGEKAVEAVEDATESLAALATQMGIISENASHFEEGAGAAVLVLAAAADSTLRLSEPIQDLINAANQHRDGMREYLNTLDNVGLFGADLQAYGALMAGDLQTVANVTGSSLADTRKAWQAWKDGDVTLLANLFSELPDALEIIQTGGLRTAQGYMTVLAQIQGDRKWEHAGENMSLVFRDATGLDDRAARDLFVQTATDQGMGQSMFQQLDELSGYNPIDAAAAIGMIAGAGEGDMGLGILTSVLVSDLEDMPFQLQQAVRAGGFGSEMATTVAQELGLVGTGFEDRFSSAMRGGGMTDLAAIAAEIYTATGSDMQMQFKEKLQIGDPEAIATATRNIENIGNLNDQALSGLSLMLSDMGAMDGQARELYDQVVANAMAGDENALRLIEQNKQAWLDSSLPQGAFDFLDSVLDFREQWQNLQDTLGGEYKANKLLGDRGGGFAEQAGISVEEARDRVLNIAQDALGGEFIDSLSGVKTKKKDEAGRALATITEDGETNIQTGLINQLTATGVDDLPKEMQKWFRKSGTADEFATVLGEQYGFTDQQISQFTSTLKSGGMEDLDKMLLDLYGVDEFKNTLQTQLATGDEGAIESIRRSITNLDDLSLEQLTSIMRLTNDMPELFMEGGPLADMIQYLPQSIREQFETAGAESVLAANEGISETATGSSPGPLSRMIGGEFAKAGTEVIKAAKTSLDANRLAGGVFEGTDSMFQDAQQLAQQNGTSLIEALKEIKGVDFQRVEADAIGSVQDNVVRNAPGNITGGVQDGIVKGTQETTILQSSIQKQLLESFGIDKEGAQQIIEEIKGGGGADVLKKLLPETVSQIFDEGAQTADTEAKTGSAAKKAALAAKFAGGDMGSAASRALFDMRKIDLTGAADDSAIAGGSIAKNEEVRSIMKKLGFASETIKDFIEDGAVAGGTAPKLDLAGGAVGAGGLAEMARAMSNVPIRDVVNQTPVTSREDLAKIDVPGKDAQDIYSMSEGVAKELVKAQSAGAGGANGEAVAEGTVRLDLEMSTPWGDQIKKQVDILVDEGRVAPGSVRAVEVYDRR